MSPMKRLTAMFALAAVLSSLLQGCAPVVIGGTAMGVSVVHDRRDSATVLDDKKIVFQIQGQISEDKSLGEHASIGVTSYHRVVLLIGQAETPEIKARIAAIARAAPKVKRVVDEVSIGPRSSLGDESNDAYLTSQVKLALFSIEIVDFDPSRIKVVTEQKVVYLMGLVTAEEATATVEKARYVKGVKRVVRLFENYTQPKS